MRIDCENMILLTKLNDQEFAINHKMIETIQENPDTTIKMSNGNTYLVKESLNQILLEIKKFENSINA